MSVLLLYLEPEALHVTRVQSGAAASVRAVAFNASAPQSARERILPELRTAIAELSGERSAGGGPTNAGVFGVLLIDSALLEIAEVNLPPVSEREQRALFRRDADRHVPIEGPVAVTLAATLRVDTRPMVYACSAPWLIQVQQVIAEVLPVQATLALPVALALAKVTSNKKALPTATSAAEGALAALSASAFDWRKIPEAAQLSDEPTEQRLHRMVQRQRVQAIGLAAAAVAVMLWLGNSWRERRLATLEQQAAALVRTAEPAESARDRLVRAQAELGHLAADAQQAAQGASAVLARVGERLPSDAFVQRAEWDGAAWRLDGSAINAAALVPRLESDSLLRNVRSLAPSTRFLDGGRPRNSFSIGFVLPTAEERP
jgi:hypothetical protein